MKKAVHKWKGKWGAKWCAAFLLGLVAPFSFAGDDMGEDANEADALRKAWLSARLYGNDNDGAALRRVTIRQTQEGKYIVLITNQFGFQCDLAFGEDGYPRQLSNCVSESEREGKSSDDVWRVKEPEVIQMSCTKLAKEVVCRGDYTLAAGNFVSSGQMTIAMARAALPKSQAGLIDRPTLAYCSRQNVNIRSKPTTDSDVIGSLDAGRVVALASWNTVEGAWYKVDLPKEKGSGWVFGEYVSVTEDPMPGMARLLLDFGVTPAKAQALFGPPQKVARTELQWEGESAVRETLFYPEHQAVYTAGRLTGVTLEEGSTLALAGRRLGQAASSLAALGEADSKEGGEWTFAVTPADFFVFKIRQNKIAGAQYRFEPEEQQ